MKKDKRKPFTSKRPNGYHYIYFWENGKRKSISTESKSQSVANQKLKDFEPGKREVCLKDLETIAVKYAKTNLSKKTAGAYELLFKRLLGFLGNPLLTDIKKFDLNEFIQSRLRDTYRGKPYSKFSINQEIAYMKKSFNIAEEKEWGINPARFIKKFTVKSKRIPFEPSEMDLILEHFKGSEYYYPLYISFKSGLRRGESCNLQWSQIDIPNRKITLQNKITKETEYTYFGNEILNIFNELKAKNIQSIDGYIYGKKYNGDTLYHVIKRAIRALGLNDKLCFHSTRHTAITHWVNTLDIHLANGLARHSTLEQTMAYTHIKQKQLKEAVEKL